MKRFVKYLLPCLAAALLLASCSESRLQQRCQKRTLAACRQAEALTAQLVEKLNSPRPDSILQMEFGQSGVCFYLFDAMGLRYWSDNSLAISRVSADKYDRWFYQHFNNAHCLCRWTGSNEYALLTVLPVKMDYPYENHELRNDFCGTFAFLNGRMDLSDTAVESGLPVYNKEGEMLFALHKAVRSKEQKRLVWRIADSFSYNRLLTENDEQVTYIFSARTRLYFLLCLLLIAAYALYMGLMGWRMWRRHSFHMRHRLLIVFSTILILSFASVLIVSLRYVRRSYENQQRKDLEQRTAYIQKSLQELYFWNQVITPSNTSSLNIDLQDLSFTYKTDINVFDLHGQLVGSSQPSIFERNLVGQQIAPEVYFAREATMTQTEHIGRLHYLSSYTELYNGDYVQLGYIAVPLFISSEEVAQEQDRLLSRLLPIYILIIIIAIMLSARAARSITNPLILVSRKMNELRIGNANQKISYSQNDEVGMLVQQYNSLVDELDHSARLLAISEREGAWKTMARQVAHEIKNPLTPMRLTIQQLQRMKQKGGEDYDEYFDRTTALLIEQIDNLSRIASSFSAFAKLPDPVVEPVDVAQKLSAVATLFANNEDGIAVTYLGATEGVVVMTDQEQITQVFNNLLKNALQAAAGQPDALVRISLSDFGEWVTINITDNGPGIADDIRDRIFMPNFTTKSTGMGLGLAICKKIVEASGGSISFTSDGSLTTFTVELRKSKGRNDV